MSGIGPALRPARASDLDAIARIEREGFADSWSAELLRHELDNPEALLLVALREDQAAAYAVFRRGFEEVELLRIAVLPAERRGGLARALLDEGLERLRREGWPVCHLEVRAGNTPALALYARLGFTRIGRRPAYYRDGEDAILMARELRAEPPEGANGPS